SSRRFCVLKMGTMATGTMAVKKAAKAMAVTAPHNHQVRGRLRSSRYSAIIAVAIGGRMVGALAFLIAALLGPDLRGLLPLAAGDFAFGAVHAAAWLPIRS
ncbi:MAG: hypothetical protein ACJ76N_00350, partial [Thermoanaerobaculia bacterium]